MAVAEVLTGETVAVKAAAVEPAGTFTAVGTLTALLSLAMLTANPPVPAAVFSDTVQATVPDPEMELLAQVRPLSTGTPVPFRFTTVVVPDVELLVSVRVPKAAPAAMGSN